MKLKIKVVLADGARAIYVVDGISFDDGKLLVLEGGRATTIEGWRKFTAFHFTPKAKPEKASRAV